MKELKIRVIWDKEKGVAKFVEKTYDPNENEEAAIHQLIGALYSIISEQNALVQTYASKKWKE